MNFYAMLFSYAAASINEPGTSETLTFINHPPSNGDSLTVPGVSFNASLTSMTVPETGEYTSEAALTDSTTPKDLVASISAPTSGSST